MDVATVDLSRDDPAARRELRAQFHGCSRVGGEHTRGRPDWREQFDAGPERPPLELGPGDPRYLRLIGPNQWTTALPELRAAVHRVLSPPGGRDRFSAAFFLAPRSDAVVGRRCRAVS
ncbi:2-oxoglutarate and iron-dependent oxygenase domain-containing protein [Nocardia wallacei]|uniref:2-oxoglutarate and iron-dependent oxygenase domain-containing protein n=1 Tax=Nocardia wallacei TaxID=480035 RepID=UPI003CC7F31D